MSAPRHAEIILSIDARQCPGINLLEFSSSAYRALQGSADIADNHLLLTTQFDCGAGGSLKEKTLSARHQPRRLRLFPGHPAPAADLSPRADVLTSPPSGAVLLRCISCNNPLFLPALDRRPTHKVSTIVLPLVKQADPPGNLIGERRGGLSMNRIASFASHLSGEFARISTHILSAPAFALMTLVVITVTRGRAIPGAMLWAGIMILLISLLPWVTSAESPLLPKMNPRTRRIISFAGCITGYTGAVVVAFAGQAPPVFQALACSYLGTAVLLAAVNLFYRASGHASGVAGPAVAFIMLFRAAAIPVLAIIPLAMWARVKGNKHTLGQTVVGALVAVVATYVAFKMTML